MKSIVAFAVAALTLIPISAGRAGPVIADLAADWSNSSNPNGTWQYREGTINLPFVAGWLPSGGGQSAWAAGNVPGDYLPAWFRSAGFDWQAGGVDLLPGDIGVHPNDCSNGGTLCNLTANVLWTSSVDGLVTISGNVWDADEILGRSDAFQLLLNGSAIAGGSVLFGINTRANPLSYSISENLHVGDQIEFDITGLQTATFAGVNLTITSNVSELSAVGRVPEPSSVSLFVAALLTLALLPRFTRRRHLGK